MTDFVEYRPRSESSVRFRSDPQVAIRRAAPGDTRGPAVVRSVRGGSVDEHLEASQRLIERLPVILVAESDGELVGWCGAQRSSIEPDAEPEWLIAGITVVPELRRSGIAALLLGGVMGAVRSDEPGTAIFSVINARNLASIALHGGLGFSEIARRAEIARIEFAGGEGVLLRSRPDGSAARD